MLNFYDIDEEYINYLKKYEAKIPNIKYDSNSKFICGVVLNIKNHNYYAPVSHITTKMRTSFLIKNETRNFGSIRFSFMFPATPNVLTRKDLSKLNIKYADLLRRELEICRSHSQDIQRLAERVYKIGCNPNHNLYSVCCDFKKLEDIYQNYNA